MVPKLAARWTPLGSFANYWWLSPTSKDAGFNCSWMWPENHELWTYTGKVEYHWPCSYRLSCSFYPISDHSLHILCPTSTKKTEKQNSQLPSDLTVVRRCAECMPGLWDRWSWLLLRALALTCYDCQQVTSFPYGSVFSSEKYKSKYLLHIYHVPATLKASLSSIINLLFTSVLWHKYTSCPLSQMRKPRPSEALAHDRARLQASEFNSTSHAPYHHALMPQRGDD